MRKRWESFYNALSLISKGFAVAATVSLAGMLLIVIADTVSAQFFNHPIPLTVPIIKILNILVVYLAIGYVAIKIGHMNVLVFDRYMPSSINKIIIMIGFLMAIPMSGALSWFSFVLMKRQFVTHELESSVQHFFVWPFSALMAIGFVLLTLCFIAVFIREYINYKENKDSSSDPYS